MHHHALGLVYHDDICIFIENIQRNILRQYVRLHRLRQAEYHFVVAFYTIASLCRVSVYGNGLVLYHFLDKRARQRLDKHTDTLIESLFF